MNPPPSPADSSDSESIIEEVEEEIVNDLDHEIQNNGNPVNQIAVIPPPPYNVNDVTLIIRRILRESLSFFVTGAPRFLVAPNHPLAGYPLQPQNNAQLASLNQSSVVRPLAVVYIISVLEHDTLIQLQMIHDQETYLNRNTRTRLVICVIIGFLAYHWVDDYRFDFYQFTGRGNILAAEFVHSSGLGTRNLNPALADLVAVNGYRFDFSHLSIFSYMAQPQP